jgi:hypothetical protein
MRLSFLLAPPIAVGLAAVTALGAAMPAGAAAAAPRGGVAPLYNCSSSPCPEFSGSGVYIRKSPPSGTPLGEGQRGQKFAVAESECSANVGGDSWWDLGTDQSTGITGWSADYYVSHFAYDILGNC